MFRRSRPQQEPADASATAAAPTDAADAGLSLQELSDAYEERVSDAAGLVFAHLMSHPEDVDLDLSRGATQVPTLYHAVASRYPRLVDLGLTPTMWSRATGVALAAHREHQANAPKIAADVVSDLSA